ncbi:CHAT domain-containing tetratricopeptide repeat protein [Moorena sp. SIO3H5]|uniref:CHAT domain-containing protein n=1 Tax=Moorena sp. SIO3H5 TaxID=2607834 RepID=UPI0013BC5D4F|nr:CHAT domain-containing tetratricopeptide repeat protein [Moorena sp. SIO3H5]NEO73749.1 CHAT domain-containing protein [Moorena sp. SIO3H5]
MTETPDTETPDRESAQTVFLEQLLQATKESEHDPRSGNKPPQTVETLLSNNLELLYDDFPKFIKNWATDKFKTTELSEAQKIAKNIIDFSNIIYLYYHGQENLNREIAIAGYQVSLQVVTRETLPKKWGDLQYNIALAHLWRILGEKGENIEEAIKASKLSLEVFTKKEHPYEWARSQKNLGMIYRNRVRGNKEDNIENAIEFYKSALEVFTETEYPYNWAQIQYNLTIAYAERISGEKTKNLKKEIEAGQLALKVFSKEEYPYQWAYTHNSIGLAYRDSIEGDRAENLEKAIIAFQLALEVLSYEDYREDWAIVQNYLGTVYRRRIRGSQAENIKKAIAAYELALEVYTLERFPHDHAETLFNRGLSHLYASNFVNAYDDFKGAIKTVELLRNEIAFGSEIDEYKQKLAEDWNSLYQRMVEVCLKRNKITEAIEYVEQSKTRNLVDKILSRDQNTIFPADVVTQLEQYRDEIAIGQYQIQHKKADNPTALAQRLQELLQQRNDLQDQYLLIGSSFKFDEFQNKLDDHTAIVEFYITKNKLLTFIFTKKTQQPIVLQSEPEKFKKLEQWRNEYLGSYKNQKSDWQKNLSNRLDLLAEILPIDDIIQQITETCDRLILIPHQVLHLFPLHALPINSQQEKATSEILMDRFPAGVSYAPSCQLLQLAQTRERPDFTHLFAVQNPTDNLDYTNIGVEVIKGYFNPPPDTEVLVKNAASKAAIDSKALNTFHCVHFSCHGEFNYKEPRKSALILADAHLTLDAIFALKLEQCRLVTLSACETGVIDDTNISDEYIGLPSGFLVAGSPALVCSLWKVNELSTTLLMIKFYDNLRTAMSLGIALNQAQRWLRDVTKEKLEEYIDKLPLNFVEKYVIKAKFYNLNSSDKPFESPFHWAAFCAIGK